MAEATWDFTIRSAAFHGGQRPNQMDMCSILQCYIRLHYVGTTLFFLTEMQNESIFPLQRTSGGFYYEPEEHESGNVSLNLCQMIMTYVPIAVH